MAIESLSIVSSNFDPRSSIVKSVCDWRLSVVIILLMRGSRKFCQRGSNFDNVFLFVWFFCSLMRGEKIQIPL